MLTRARRSPSRLPAAIVFLIAFAASVICGASAMGESWHGANGGGAARNSNATPILGPLVVQYAISIPQHDYSVNPSYHGAVRFDTPLIADGKFYIAVDGNGPENWWRNADGSFQTDKWGRIYRMSIGEFDLATGARLRTILSHHANASPGNMTPLGGVMNNDQGVGRVRVHLSGGAIYIAHGSDHPGKSAVRIADGAKLPAGRLVAGPNASGCFIMADANHANHKQGGTMEHSAYYGRSAWYCWGSGCAQGNSVWLARTMSGNTGGYGGAIIGYWDHPIDADGKLGEPAWEFRSQDVTLTNYQNLHGLGGPGAYCLADDGSFLYLSFNSARSSTGTFTTYPAQGVFLRSVTAAGKAGLSLPSGFSPGAISNSPYTSQLATRGGYAVAFQPQTPYFAARLSIFDIIPPGRLVAIKAWPAGAFRATTNVLSRGSGLEQAVQVVIAGDAAYVVEPSLVAGALQLRVWRFILATGAEELFVLTTNVPAAGVIACREVAAVDGGLLVLVDVQGGQVAARIVGTVTETTP